jgi:hypothetical protein
VVERRKPSAPVPATPLANSCTTLSVMDSMRREIWNHMLDAEMNKRFYAKLVARAARRHRWLSASSVVATSAAALNLATEAAGKQASLALAVLAAALTAISSAWDFRRDALDAERLCQDWVEIGARWDALWADYESGETEGARAAFDKLDERVRAAIVRGARFEDERLVRQIMPVVERVRGAVAS